jgi:hypothetical protein
MFRPTAALIAMVLSSSASAIELTSSDGRIRADVAVEGGVLGYRVLLDGHEVVARSPLGVDSSAGNFITSVRVDEQSDSIDVEQEYVLHAGKRRDVKYAARESVVSVVNDAGGRLEVQLRIANDGVAFRYRFPEDAGASIQVQREATSFAFPDGTTTFLHPMAVSKSGWMRTQPSYEEHYVVDAPVGKPSPLGQGWCLPALFKVGERGWVLVGETGVGAGYFGARLAEDSSDGVYRVDLPQPAEHADDAPVEPTVAGGQWLPWRFVIVGKTLEPIVASTMATDLVEPLYEIPSRPNPGRAVWSWLPLKDDHITEPVQRRFIDMAAELKFEYVLVDNYWDAKIGREGIERLADYARGKGVGLILWYNSNGSWNDAPQTPQDRMHTAEVRAEEMAWLERTGIKGIKVDFFGGDKQAVMALYDGVLRDAAKHGIMCNFHGCTIPRGWDRMYPNFVTCEAVRGMEFCTFEQANADREAQHATILPFTRNVIGPMDFTPVMVGRRLGPNNDGPRRRTTLAFELALPVAFYSAVQHFGLVPEDLERLPLEALNYLRGVPTVWDETRLLDGYPGQFVVLARRKGERWYVAALNGQQEARRVSVPAELAKDWAILRDRTGEENAVEVEPLASPAEGAVQLELPPRGGAVMWSR